MAIGSYAGPYRRLRSQAREERMEQSRGQGLERLVRSGSKFPIGLKTMDYRVGMKGASADRTR